MNFLPKNLVIMAMLEEADALFVKYNLDKIRYNQDANYNLFQLSTDTALLISGIGMINSAIAVTNVFNQFPSLQTIYNIGSAGALNTSLSILDVCLVNKSSFSLVDCCNFGYKFGQTPQEKPFLETNSKLLSTVQKKINEEETYNVTIGTSDNFIEKKDAEFIKKNHDLNLDILDMEYHSLAFAASKLNLDIIGIKIVSDIILKPSNSFEFRDNLKKVSCKIVNIIEDLHLV